MTQLQDLFPQELDNPENTMTFIRVKLFNATWKFDKMNGIIIFIQHHFITAFMETLNSIMTIDQQFGINTIFEIEYQS